MFILNFKMHIRNVSAVYNITISRMINIIYIKWKNDKRECPFVHAKSILNYVEWVLSLAIF